MRHGRTHNHLGRTTTHRKAMLANMATSLILNKRIATTLAKAKELKKYIEPMITKAKVDSTHNRRTVFSSLKHKEPIKELFSTVIEKVGDRPGGYTRILKTGHRLGDNADMCIIELVDFNDSYTTQKEVAKAKTRRGRAKKASDTATLNPSDVNTATEMTETVTSAEVIEETPTMEAHTDVIEEVAVEETPMTEEHAEVAAEEVHPIVAEDHSTSTEEESTPSTEESEKTDEPQA